MKLSKESAEFAVNHNLKYSDSDFFIKPIEFEAIRTFKNDTIDYLISKEISSFNIENPKTFAVPKPKGGYRIVHQLDPINTLLYTALTYEIASFVEGKRIPVNKKSVCSYRIEITADSFFNKDTGYADYAIHSAELADKYGYVLITDIVDFYNQIYLHRLQNSIESCDDSFHDISKAIENFILSLNNKNSKGIPVGPSASIVLAEALLLDIDQFLLDKGFEFVRYVDDIRVFADQQIDLEWLLHDLTDYIYDNHRLTLSSSKTKIIDCDAFKRDYLQEADELEKNEVHKELELLKANKLTQLNSRINFTQYSLPDPEEEENIKLTKEEMLKVRSIAFKKIMDVIVNKDCLDLGLSRHILRQSTRYNSRAILQQLLDNFDYFIPVLRDVVLYLIKVTNDKMIEHNIVKFEDIIKKSSMIHFPFAKYWMQYYFASFIGFYKSDLIRKYLLSGDNILSGAIYAKNTKNISWVRQYKNKISQLNSIERRLVLYSSLALSRDERKHWMEFAKENAVDFLDNILARYLLTF